ncbi:MAG: DUF5667 domain-containing protein, partial [bacterium]|nr:DUF5667 domain-containing protein [bacterium]
MNDFFTQLKQEALNTKLSHNEKQAIRLALYDAMKKPLAVMQEVKVVRAVRSSYVWFSPRFALPVAVFLIVGLGTGTAYASQASVPGDTLYSIKVNITEPALGALAISDGAKAQWHAQVAQTRLEEAETLAASGKLDATTSAELSQDFDEHSNEAQAFAQKVEDESPGSGAELTAQFDSSLVAHEAILTRVGSDSDDSSKRFADDFATQVRKRGSNHGSVAIEAVSVQTFSAVAPEAPSATVTATSAS